MSEIRIYADTSVFGGAFDEEFQTVTRTFFSQVRNGRFKLVTSALVQEEIDPAPAQVRELFDDLLNVVDVVEVSEEALDLKDAYLETGIVTAQWNDDALHVALATVAGCSLIVSWNFKHIVHFEKIPLYNAVNTLKGYGNIGIFSPLEVIQYES
ncbi:MAG TPA: type II toxin-antitoxin system VapC family toxin [Candidatus Binatia bacterium]|nr:type II toxin-antitoxin system VapC family toxin [Candidatus Binatia bacterium]